MSDRIPLIIVDDDQELLRMLSVFFATDGVHAVAFDRAPDALAHLASHPGEIMLADIILPGMHGLELAEKAKRLQPSLNIIMMTGYIDEFSFDDAIAAGASDFIKKPFSLNELRMRIKHVQLQEKLRILSITDELTGLPNRRGFFALAEQQLKFAARAKRQVSLLFFDMDDFKTINDTWGHQEGDRALIAMSSILQKSCRDSDIVARMSGDEFAVLLIDTPGSNVQTVLERVAANILHFNRQRATPYELSVSIGHTSYQVDQPCSIDEMIRDADIEMYAVKQLKKARHSGR